MPVYRYIAIAPDGTRIKSTLTAPDEGAASRWIKTEGHIVQDLSELTGADAAAGKFDMRLPVRTKERILFFRMFSSLIESHVSISESIGILQMQVESRKMKQILLQVKTSIEEGIPLSDAFARHPGTFPPSMTAMIRAGEMGGILDVVIDRIADDLEKRAALRSKMILTLIYPAIVLVVSLAVVAFLVGFVIPQFSVLLQGRALPPNTRFLLDTADLLTNNTGKILLGFLILTGTAILVMATDTTRRYIDRYKIYLPVVGPVMRYGVIVQFARTFASLLGSGITLMDALKSVGGTISNIEVRELLQGMIQQVTAGNSLSSALEKQRFFTPMAMAMIKIGEQTGLMDQAMSTTADLHEKILVAKISRMTALIEPALILSLGGLVGYVAWGLVAGILSLYGQAT
jgi:type IV pilus assembly protein PilC